MTLRAPVEPMLAQAAEAVPGSAALRAGVACEQKPDGHRALLFTAAGPGGTVLVQTRRGAPVQDRWPDLVAAAEAQLPHGLFLDGDPVVWDTEAGRLSFEALQCRAAARARGAARGAVSLAARWPAYSVAFDLLQQGGQELSTRPYDEGRALLENLFSEHALTAPWTPCPQTTNLARAREWLESWTVAEPERDCPLDIAAGSCGTDWSSPRLRRQGADADGLRPSLRQGGCNCRQRVGSWS
ncbi:ATP-dependent DNA ligase [Streptomyces sp. NPDC054787]